MRVGFVVYMSTAAVLFELSQSVKASVLSELRPATP